jgi:hypothetical protein
MNNYTKKLETELLESDLMQFEIKVININMASNDYATTDHILCDVYFQGNSIIAERDPVSEKEKRSKYIASTRLVVDNCYGLDSHLQSLYEMILDDIMSGDMYELTDNS